MIGASAAGAVALLLAAFAALFAWASSGRQSPGEFDGPVHDYGSGPAPEAGAPDLLVVMTWNIAYAHGPGSEGPGYAIRPSDEAAARLARIGEAIRGSRADVALLQEVDFDCGRSHRVDQLEALARSSGLRHAAHAVSWRARYVPFPYWPPGGQWGRMESGGAVLSRYPITANRVTLHPKPRANSRVYNAFYLFRYSQVVTIRAGGRELRVVNNHLDAWDRANREEQARSLAEMVGALAESGGVDLLGGDLNTAPPEAKLLHGFPDEPEADFRGDATLGIVRGIPGLVEVAGPVVDGEEAFTFPSWGPNRRIDHLFARAGVTVRNVRVLETGDLSDHLPVIAEIDWPRR